MATQVQVIRPFLGAAGWYMEGETPTIDDAQAQKLEADGYCLIQSVDGAPVVWPSCCSGGDHDHA